jgi:hypothetical protein
MSRVINDHKINLKLYSTQHSKFVFFQKFVKKVEKSQKTGECKNMSNIPRCRNYRPCRSIISLLVTLLRIFDFWGVPKKHQKVRLINILVTWRFWPPPHFFWPPTFFKHLIKLFIRPLKLFLQTLTFLNRDLWHFLTFGHLPF